VLWKQKIAPVLTSFEFGAVTLLWNLLAISKCVHLSFMPVDFIIKYNIFQDTTVIGPIIVENCSNLGRACFHGKGAFRIPASADPFEDDKFLVSFFMALIGRNR
jgi:hypothetical protein